MIELLLTLIDTLEIINEISHLVVESSAFSSPKFLILIFNNTFNPTVGGICWVVIVNERELLLGCEIRPESIKFIYELGITVSIAETRSRNVIDANLFFHLLFIIECLEQSIEHLVKVLRILGRVALEGISLHMLLQILFG